ncbi:thioesterase II family protein [Streptomyces palmae]|uniref:Thioesterase n=1 Tax=Streptomyces palmae TaxID=1701085 RepID=A0A4Z0HCM2_9ACTN|nr:alpha/beta fold hydrolase [Streptomyces palmae]TGB09268.1 thioesterase [Streptomyces palmae]
MSYLRSFTPAEEGTAGTVVVFPQSGAGCLRLRALAPALPSGLRLLGVQLPGREDRLQDPPASGLSEVVDHLSAELRELPSHRPPAFLGLSLGAIIAFEVARRLESEGVAPRSLLVAAARSPEYWRDFPAADPPLAELTALLPPAVRGSGLADYALATMRADLRLMADYRVPSAPLTGTPLRSVSGRHDDIVTTEQMSGWQERSTDYRGHHMIDADHHHLMDQEVLIGLLSDAAFETAPGGAVRR